MWRRNIDYFDFFGEKKKKSCLFIVIRGLYSSFYIRDANNCIQKVKKEYLED